MSGRAGKEFERGFARWRRYWNVRPLVNILFMAVLVAGCLALGWGWGYNSRVTEECEAADGQWQTGAQICIDTDKGTIIDLGKPGVNR